MKLKPLVRPDAEGVGCHITASPSSPSQQRKRLPSPVDHSVRDGVGGRRLLELDIMMDAWLQKEIKGMNADPDFVEFVMGWHGVIGATAVPFTTEKESSAYQRKIKRWTQRDCGTMWRGYWQMIVSEWKSRRKVVLQRNPFTMEPQAFNLNHRRRDRGRWDAIFDLRNYFISIDQRPHMRLLGLLLYPAQLEDTFKKEWNERKDWFEDEKGPERLERLEHFYAHHHDRIIETLRTGIPFYAKWESASSVSPSVISH